MFKAMLMSCTEPCALPAPAASRSATCAAAVPGSLNWVSADAGQAAAHDVGSRDARLGELLDALRGLGRRELGVLTGREGGLAELVEFLRGAVSGGVNGRHLALELGR